YDAILRSTERRKQLRPDYIIRFGAMPVSKMYRFYLESHVKAERYVISEQQQYREPSAIETRFIHSNINLFVEGMLEQSDPQPHPSNWLTNWKRMDEEACRILSKHDSDGLTEGETVAQLTNLLS